MTLKEIVNEIEYIEADYYSRGIDYNKLTQLRDRIEKYISGIKEVDLTGTGRAYVFTRPDGTKQI